LIWRTYTQGNDEDIQSVPALHTAHGAADITKEHKEDSKYDCTGLVLATMLSSDFCSFAIKHTLCECHQYVAH
jgi:hypothetical protein